MPGGQGPSHGAGLAKAWPEAKTQGRRRGRAGGKSEKEPSREQGRQAEPPEKHEVAALEKTHLGRACGTCFGGGGRAS